MLFNRITTPMPSTQPRKEPQVTTPQALPTRPLHEQAAAVADHILTLQEQLRDSQELIAKLESDCRLFHADNTHLKTVNEKLQSERDYHHKRSTEIQTKLTLVAQIVLDVMKEPDIQIMQPVGLSDRLAHELADAPRGEGPRDPNDPIPQSLTGSRP